mmetsp:Transcript_28024/g.70318  ORF Transcript_28024/g.70318 Transcript_28024/m.70318 type:complete len:360 (+) Transcript_28024:153-1232(+)
MSSKVVLIRLNDGVDSELINRLEKSFEAFGVQVQKNLCPANGTRKVSQSMNFSELVADGQISPGSNAEEAEETCKVSVACDPEKDVCGREEFEGDTDGTMIKRRKCVISSLNPMGCSNYTMLSFSEFAASQVAGAPKKHLKKMYDDYVQDFRFWETRIKGLSFFERYHRFDSLRYLFHPAHLRTMTEDARRRAKSFLDGMSTSEKVNSIEFLQDKQIPFWVSDSHVREIMSSSLQVTPTRVSFGPLYVVRPIGLLVQDVKVFFPITCILGDVVAILNKKEMAHAEDITKWTLKFIHVQIEVQNNMLSPHHNTSEALEKDLTRAWDLCKHLDSIHGSGPLDADVRCYKPQCSSSTLSFRI